MEYQKTNVNAFLGLENNQRPELIKNEEASDIENLRFEKLGYLVNRNGVEGHPLYLTKYLDIADIQGALWSIGTVGLTEYIIEKPWGIGSGEVGEAPYDDFTLGVYSPTAQGQSKFTDRFMVYCARIPASKVAPSGYRTDSNNESNKDFTGNAVEPANRYTWRYKAAYLLMPLTGPSGWRDTFAFAPNANKLSLSSAGTGPSIQANGTNQLLAGTYYRVSTGAANLTAAPYAGNVSITLLYGTNAAATAGTIILVNTTITLPVTPGLTWRVAVLSYEPADLTLPGLYATFGSRSILRADDKPNKLQIYAPSRWLGVHNQFSDLGVPKDLNWIEHYVTMQQYRESVIISDMTNGDMQLVDEYAEAEYQDVKKHRFTLRENALAHFDVDDVVVDFGIGAGQFNEGVEAPMALYKFYLKSNRLTATQDNFKPYYFGMEESPQIIKYRNDVRTWKTPKSQSCFIVTELFKAIYDEPDAAVIAGISIDELTRYTFSNNSQTDEYDDLFSELTLQNPDIKEDDQVASDVYLWKDLKINYYPVSGVVQNQLFLTGKDRTWNKTNSAGTKIVKLTTHTGVQQDVPLGVWRYRFVWYMGNGEYSAPSSELILPDLLFSGIKDSDITSALGSYKRPFGVSSYEEAEQTASTLASTYFVNQSARMQGVKIFDASGNLTTGYGVNFIRIKEKLFEPSHVFAARYTTTFGVSWPTNWSLENNKARGQVAVLATLYWPSNYLVLEGTAVETANSSITVEEKPFGFEYKSTESYTPDTLPLRVPLFSDAGAGTHTYNSVFTTYGVLRTAYQNAMRNSSSALYNNTLTPTGYPAYQIVFEGKHRYGVALDTGANYGQGYVKSDVIQDKAGVWFNVVPFKGGTITVSSPALMTVEYNNLDDDDASGLFLTPPYKPWEFRNTTLARGVKNEADRLLFLEPNLPAEVISRIVLSGTGEIPLCDYGDRGTVVHQKRIYNLGDADGDSGVNNKLKNADIRIYTDAESAFNQETYSYGTSVPGLATVQTNDYRHWIYSASLAASPGNTKINFTNVHVAISGPGERLTIPEQLSMYIPASLLFNAPHLKLVIPANRVPRRARQLLVFRTRATHDNAWQPHDYGLVKSIDVIRNANGVLTGAHANSITFLDDVKSDELDYSYSIPDYDGFTNPIKSRFCLPLNERVFYANIKESYKPHTPRNAVDVVSDGNVTNVAHSNINYGSQAEMKRLWSYRLVTNTASDPATTNITYNNLYYFVAYNDQARSFSLASFSGLIQRSASNQKPLFFCMPSAYDTSVEHLNVYRLQTSSVITKLEITTPRTTGQMPVGRSWYVAQGAVEYNGQVYYPNDVIQTFNGNDVGYDVTRVNRFINYFENTGTGNTDRGFANSYCHPILYDITDHFDTSTGPQYIEKIGTIKPEDEGIFYDNDLPSLGRLPIKQIFQNEDIMPAGLRWSEPYQPNKIKLPSLMEVRSGDGDQITGLAMLYGNLIVLKERSMHRLAVQGAAVPVSRVDEISNNVGCIAPNTVITVNNTLYFLSWAGFYKYDNNQLMKIDGKFAEELQLRLRSSQSGVINPAIRDASCGWNPTYRELYLTIPVMSTNNNEGDYSGGNTMGVTITDNKGTRELRAVTYVINIDTGLVTKYRYMDDSVYFTDPSTWMQQLYAVAPTQRAPRVYSRLYYTNTLGQMRSGECLPPRTINYLLPFVPDGNDTSMEWMRVSFFIESPTKDANNRDKSNDDYLMFNYDPITFVYSIVNVTKFVRVFWSSKSWTAEDKSVLKRIRKVFSYIAASDDPVILRGIVHTSPEGETATTDTTWQYTYVDSRPASPRFNYSVTGEIMGVPTEAAGNATSPSQNRGERHTFNVEGSGSFQMEYFGFYWKPINQYER